MQIFFAEESLYRFLKLYLLSVSLYSFVFRLGISLFLVISCYFYIIFYFCISCDRRYIPFAGVTTKLPSGTLNTPSLTAAIRFKFHFFYSFFERFFFTLIFRINCSGQAFL